MIMKKNDEFELICTDLSDQGFGVGHHEQMTIFVRDLLPGEKALVRIIRMEKRYAIARVMRRLITSPDRVIPVCEVAGKCGGCALMHLDYPVQLIDKRIQLQTLFEKVDPSIQVLAPIGSENPYYYRNKAQFPIGVENGKVVGGFYRPKTNTIVPVRACKIQNPVINDIYAWLLDHLSLKQAEVLRHLLIRYSKKTRQAQVVLIGSENADFKPLCDALVKAFPQIRSVVFNENRRADNIILGDRYTVLYGSDSIDENCLGLEISLHFKSFFQVNPEMMERLYQCALDFAGLKKDERVIELYSGTGTIGLLASREAKEVTGVEIVQEAVDNAKENAKRNHIENATFVCMDASKFTAQNENSADVVFVDPPRKGMSMQGIDDICRLSPRCVIYISCNPRTLARDLGIFKEKGYLADVIQPVDMFSHTTGMECVARLRKEDPQAKADLHAHQEAKAGSLQDSAENKSE